MNLHFNVKFFLVVCCCWTVFHHSSIAQPASKPLQTLFDGTLDGWEGDLEKTWRVENGAITAGSLRKPVPRNEFLSTKKRYADFELTLRFKITGTEKINAGVQFRTERIPNHHEVRGYQADIGPGYHGGLYDESRRNRLLAAPDETITKKVNAAIPADGWQTYRIRAVGPRIQLWLNEIPTVDYTETDDSIATDGVIALQIHGDMIGTIAYDQIKIQDLSAEAKAKPTITDMAWIAGHWRGTAMGGEFEETWNPPLGGAMMGMFKFVNDEKIEFYELMTILPEGDSFVLRLKHFDNKLVGWEEKDKSVEFPLESVSEREIRFGGLTFQKVSADEIVIEVDVEEEGTIEKLRFECQRVPTSRGL